MMALPWESKVYQSKSQSMRWNARNKQTNQHHTQRTHLSLLKVHKNRQMNARKEIPIHKRIITPLILRSQHVILPLLRDQSLIGINAEVLVRRALELERVLGKDGTSAHSLHSDEEAEPEMEGSSEEVDVGVACV